MAGTQLNVFPNFLLAILALAILASHFSIIPAIWNIAR